MKHRIVLLTLTIILSVSGAVSAQSARESTHIVQPGETLAVIASRYDVDLNDLAALNGIYNYHLIHSWQELTIPGFSNEEVPIVVEDRTHIVRYGETLSMIAELHDIDLTELKTLNDLYGKVIYAGHELQLPLSTSPDASARYEPLAAAQSRQHIVQYGETLGTIAAAYAINLNELIVINGIFGHIIYPGQALTLPDADGQTIVPSATSVPVAETSQPVTLGSQLSYVVRAGDTLGDLAKHFGITLTAILRANDIVYPHHIYVGQHLWIPSTGSAALNVANVEPAPVVDSPTEASDPEITEIQEDSGEPVPTGPPPGDYFEHTVQFGETLGILAVHYGITIQQLMDASRITDPNHVESGQALWIPGSAKRRDPPPPPQLPEPVQQPATEVTTAPVAEGEREVYVVQPGDYLSLIGNKLATDWVAMAEINAIVNPDSLRVGMTLLVPNSDDLLKYGSSYSNSRYNLTNNHPGAHVGIGREFVVVLNTQMAYAYEDGILQKASLVSTGLPATPTVQGDFAIYRKRRSQSMTGPDYDLDNVEWVMYFFRGYSFHGTWWHNNFGQPMSHGCVNMTNADAKWFYDFGSLGTPVHVQYY